MVFLSEKGGLQKMVGEGIMGRDCGGSKQIVDVIVVVVKV